jgi:hypothetical protein
MILTFNVKGNSLPLAPLTRIVQFARIGVTSAASPAGRGEKTLLQEVY